VSKASRRFLGASHLSETLSSSQSNPRSSSACSASSISLRSFRSLAISSDAPRSSANFGRTFALTNVALRLKHCFLALPLFRQQPREHLTLLLVEWLGLFHTRALPVS